MNRGRPVKNRHKVPQRQWKKWSNLARRVFNEVYETMRPSQQAFFQHTEAPLQRAKHWNVTRWNAAWVAASAIRAEKE